MLIFVDESEWPKPSAPEGYTVWAAAALKPQLSKEFSREILNLEKNFGKLASLTNLRLKVECY